MVKTNHGCAASARRELVDAGYVLAFSSSGTPERWSFYDRAGSDPSKPVYTVGWFHGPESKVWEIAEYT